MLGLAGSAWILPFLFAFTVIDGFFPPIPSESLVIALAAMAVAGDGPPLWAVFVVAAVGAFVGDSIAYGIGRWSDLSQRKMLQRPRIKAIFAFADRSLRTRGATIILSARYIPVGRVAVNMTAGALRFPYRRFLLVDAGASVMWSAYSVLLGWLAGQWLDSQPLMAAALGIVGGLILGYIIDRVMTRRGGGDIAKLADDGEAKLSEPS